MRRLIALAGVLLIAVGAPLACLAIDPRAAPGPTTTEPPATDDVTDDANVADPVALDGDADPDRQRVGSLGWALLSPEVPRVVLEIDGAPGTFLDDEAIDALVGKLEEHGGKTVEVRRFERLPRQQVYGLDELAELGLGLRSAWSDEDVVVVHVMAVPGRFETPGVVGVAMLSSTFAVMIDEIADLLPNGAAFGAFEASVAVHELGHLFGLVNLTGEGAFNEDPSSPGHSPDVNSVMNAAVETTSLREVFFDGPPRDFAPSDLREMERIRNLPAG